MTQWLLVGVSVALVLACGAFVAAEFALVTVDRGTVERAAEAGDHSSAGVLAALRSLSTQLSGAQVGITVTNLTIGFLAEPAVAGLLEGPLGALGVPPGTVTGVALTLALVVATGVTMIYGELVPKNLAITHPLETARAVQGFQRGFTKVMAWPIRFLNGTANAIVRRMGIEPQEELASARSAEELASLVGRSAQKGTLPEGTATLLQRSLAFGDKRAVDVLTPRVRVRAVPVDAPVSAVIGLTRRSGHSRFPVTGPRGLDDIVGIVHVKHAITVAPSDRRTVPVGFVMVEPTLVPASLELDPLLAQLRLGGLQMAVVVDEYGGTEGIVTMEDLVEELVGEVLDEHDRPGRLPRRLPGGGWTVPGLLRPDEVTLATGVSLPEDASYETVGGLLAAAMGRVPEEGDVLELDGHRLTVTRMAGLRVDLARLDVAPEDFEGSTGPEAPS